MKKGTGFGVNGPAEKIVGGGVTNIEFDGRVEFDEFDEIRFSKSAGFPGRFLSGVRGRETEDDDRCPQPELLGWVSRRRWGFH